MEPTDWVRIKREAAENALIPYEPADGPYDPNDEEATETYLSNAIIPEPHPSDSKQLVALRLSSEVLEHFKAEGPDWQARIDDVLKRAVGT